MRRPKLDHGTLLAAAVVGAAVLAAVVVVAVGWDRGRDESARPKPPTLPELTVDEQPPAGGQATTPEGPPPEITADVVVAPPEVLYADTVTARFDIAVDKERVDPESIRVAADFAPWQVIGKPTTRRHDDGDISYIRTTYVLRCVSGTCLPSGQSARYEFPSARIAYGAPGDQQVEERSIRAQVPPIRVFSRFAVGNRDTGPFESPWRADLTTLPAISYDISPGFLIVLLLAGAVLAGGGGVALAYVAWPRREPAPAPAPPPPPPPAPLLSPLEQALELLENSIRVNGAAEQRRALEQVAEQLELSEWGDPKLAREARVLAWSEDVPPVEVTTSLATRVRSVLPEVEEPDPSLNGDAHDE